MEKLVVIVFLDGVGLGYTDSEANPFMHVRMETGQTLFGVPYLTHEAAGTITDRAALLGLDASLGMPGLPQSATGQTAILTGQNAPAVLGEHYGPYPNQDLLDLLARHSLFKAVLEANHPVAYANAYPVRFLDRIKRGKGRLSANTRAALMAGLKLRGREDLQRGRAVAALLSNEFWPEPEVNLPPLNPYQAGSQLAALAREHTLTFFEFWYSDLLGHKMDREGSLTVLADLDHFLAGVLDGLDLKNSLLLVVSDHGNFEDWTTKKHTTNPALTILAGEGAGALASHLRALTDIKPAVMTYLFAKAF
jgi:hypothetical protein